MPPKRKNSKMKTPKANKKHKVAPDDTAESPALMTVKQNIYRFEREKASLKAKLELMKKELSLLRASRRESEFRTLQNPNRQEEMAPELLENVELWQKYTGFSFDKVTYLDEDTKSWLLNCRADGLPFKLNITFKKDELTNRGCVDKCLLEILDPCKDEIQPHINTGEGNIEQIFKILKVYYQSYKAREEALNECKEKFGNLINVTQSEGKVVEICTATTFYFKIAWKLVPSPKHFARMKNICRLSSTKEGDEYIKSNADISAIKKQLNKSPIEVISLLARGIGEL